MHAFVFYKSLTNFRFFVIIPKKIQQRKINVDIELESLKKTLTYLRDQQKVFYDFTVDQEDN